MYTLTKEQKLANLKESLEQRKSKLQRLEEEIQNLQKKIEKLSGSTDNNLTYNEDDDISTSAW